MSEYYIDNKEKIRNRHRKYYAENRDKILAQMKEYRLTHKADIKKSNAEYRKRNIDRIRAYDRARSKHLSPERKKQRAIYGKKWKEQNKVRVYAQNNKRRRGWYKNNKNGFKDKVRLYGKEFYRMGRLFLKTWYVRELLKARGITPSESIIKLERERQRLERVVKQQQGRLV